MMTGTYRHVGNYITNVPAVNTNSTIPVSTNVFKLRNVQTMRKIPFRITQMFTANISTVELKTVIIEYEIRKHIKQLQ